MARKGGEHERAAGPERSESLPAGLPQSVVVLGVAHPLEALYGALAVTSDLEGLTRALQQQAQAFAYWGMLEVAAKSEAERASAEAKRVHAELFVEYQRRLAESLAKAPTVDALKAAVARDPRYRAAVEAEIRAQETAGYLTVARQALQQRMAALAEIGHTLRSEIHAKMRDRVLAAEDRMQTVFPHES